MNYLKENNKKAFITYTTAGFPDMKKTKEIILAQEEAGIDVIELGIPFSDPVPLSLAFSERSAPDDKEIGHH